jgi:hypothetical protein
VQNPPGHPGPQENYLEAARRAFESLDGRTPDEIARASGGTADGAAVNLVVLGREVRADLASRTITTVGGDPVEERAAAVIARYLAYAGGLLQRQSSMIAFADRSEARGYVGPFRGRVLGPLLAKFGRDPEGFAAAAEAAGGERAPNEEPPGGVAYRLRVFPRLALLFVLNPGDEELPAEGQVLLPEALFEAGWVDDAVAVADLASRALRGGRVL